MDTPQSWMLKDSVFTQRIVKTMELPATRDSDDYQLAGFKRGLEAANASGKQLLKPSGGERGLLLRSHLRVSYSYLPGPCENRILGLMGALS